ncbi:hypothetical protein HDU67_001399 [Dinochytrium kinnereticum]|nr:hypothetical protein HDU67_001399 [Dinochytrium kinnereticum]
MPASNTHTHLSRSASSDSIRSFSSTSSSGKSSTWSFESSRASPVPTPASPRPARASLRHRAITQRHLDRAGAQPHQVDRGRFITNTVAMVEGFIGASFFSMKGNRHGHNRQEGVLDEATLLGQEEEQGEDKRVQIEKDEEGIKNDVETGTDGLVAAKQLSQITCAVCMTNAVTSVFVPCGHICMCNECISLGQPMEEDQMGSEDDDDSDVSMFTCPVCRSGVKDSVAFFVCGAQGGAQ